MEEEVRLFVCWDECSAQRLAGVNKDETTANELYNGVSVNRHYLNYLCKSSSQ